MANPLRRQETVRDLYTDSEEEYYSVEDWAEYNDGVKYNDDFDGVCYYLAEPNAAILDLNHEQDLPTDDDIGVEIPVLEIDD